MFPTKYIENIDMFMIATHENGPFIYFLLVVIIITTCVLLAIYTPFQNNLQHYRQNNKLHYLLQENPSFTLPLTI